MSIADCAPEPAPATRQAAWEATYAAPGLAHKNEYPSEMVVSYVRRCYPHVVDATGRRLRALEVGCGWGNNLRFLRDVGLEPHGIDFSPTAVAHVRAAITPNVSCGDLATLPYPDGFFDLCIDKSAIQHNPAEEIRRAHREIARVLREGGGLFSMMLRSGSNGFFATRLDEEEIRLSLSMFRRVTIDHQTLTRNNQQDCRAQYLIEAVR